MINLFQSTLAEAIATVHDQIHLSEPKMYLFDLEANPSESVVDGCGSNAHKQGAAGAAGPTAGPVKSCANLYEIPAFREIRRKLEGMLNKADRESVAPTLRWEDDGPLAGPDNFGGWVPWRDRDGDPLAMYGGVAAAQQQQQQQRVSLAGLGSRGGEQGGAGGASVSGLAFFFAMVAVGSTFVAYRAGQRSGYRVLIR